MPRPRFFKLEPEKQRRILDAAAEALVTHGYEGASLNQIIEQAGISKGAVYYYFDDKDDLIGTVMMDLWDRFFDMSAFEPEALTADDFWQTIRDWSMEAFAKVAEDPIAIGLGKLFYKMPPGVLADSAFGEKVREAQLLLEQVVTRGQAVGVVRDDVPLGLLLATVAGAAEASDRWMAEHWEELDPEEGMVVSLRLLDMLQAMLSPAGAETEPA